MTKKTNNAETKARIEELIKELAGFGIPSDEIGKLISAHQDREKKEAERKRVQQLKIDTAKERLLAAVDVYISTVMGEPLTKEETDVLKRELDELTEDLLLFRGGSLTCYDKTFKEKDFDEAIKKFAKLLG